MHHSPLESRRHGFTLVELLVVVAIIGIIAAFVAPAASNIIRGSDLTRGAEMLRGAFSYARQTATTRGHAIEVRFLQYADPEQPGEIAGNSKTYRFHAIQLMEVLPNGNEVELGQVQEFPGSIQFDPTLYSSMLDISGSAESGMVAPVLQTPNAAYDPPLPRKLSAQSGGSGLGYLYISFRFQPDGSTNLSQNTLWYVTIYPISDGVKLKAGSAITAINYFTLQVDPATGSLHTYRPSILKGGSGASGGSI